ncbi:MAG: PQQ-dependent sugar dehydrogenase [Rhodothermales bacterium]
MFIVRRRGIGHYFKCPIAIVLLAFGIGCISGSTAGAQTLVDAFSSLSFSAPVDIEAAPDGSNRLFVVQLGGRIKVFDNDPSASSAKTFLDISSQVLTGGERGFLGLAFHPDFATNGYFYVNYINSSQQSIIARFTADSVNPDTVAVGSEQTVLVQAQPASNHNGGKLQFGPDGYLYVGFGDGGGQHDPSNNGQNTSTLLGAILRLDVDGGGLAPDCGSSEATAYTIPSDNPLRDGSGGDCDEIWAYGFRNPWRFSFDPEGTLWVGDVGQSCREEIDRVHPGLNYGWDIMEGNLCHPDYVDCTLEPPDDCSTDGLELPIHDYDRNSVTGGRTVVGGMVYRGEACAPYLTGAYVYGDYGTDNVWAMDFEGDSLVTNTLLLDAGFDVVSFGEDADGELYLVEAGGSIYRFDCTGLESAEVVYPMGWHQISIPVKTISKKTTDVLSGVTLGSPVFGFSDGRFAAVDRIAPGRGYLAYFSQPDTVAFVGETVDPRTIEVTEGWNLIGPFEAAVAVGAITPSGGVNITSPFFELSTGYSSVSTLDPGRGYWVAVDSDGTLSLP